MSVAQLLNKRIGPLPAYGWAGAVLAVGSIAYYVHARRVAAAAEEMNVSAESADVDYAAAASGGEAFLYFPNIPGFKPGQQIYGDGSQNFAGVLPDPVGPGASLITVTVGDGTADTGSVSTGGGAPSTPNRQAGTLPAGWHKGNKAGGKVVKGAIGHKVMARGSNKNGKYTQHGFYHPGGRIERWNHYTSGKKKGKWVGPF